MRYWWRTCLVILCLAAMVLPAGASPGVRQGGCVIRLELDAGAAMEEPFARWLNQSAGMAVVTVKTAQWAEGACADVALDMGTERALTLRVTQVNGVTTMSSSMIEDVVTLSAVCDWAQMLLDAAPEALNVPSSGRSIPVSGEGLARALHESATSLRSWAALARAQAGAVCEACGTCDVCGLIDFSEAVAILIDAFADQFDEVIGQNVLLVSLEPIKGVDLMPIAPVAAPEAPDEFSVALVKKAVRAICYAIAGNAPDSMSAP